MKKTIPRKARFLLVLFSAPLWLGCLFLFFETAWRIYVDKTFNYAHSRVVDVSDEYRRSDDVVFQKAHTEFPPPDSVPSQVKHRSEFAALDDSGRHDLARERHELILVCDYAGKVTEVYPCMETPELVRLSDRIKSGDTLDVLFPPAEYEDALNAIRQAGETEKPVRDYHIPLGDDQWYLAEINVFRVSTHPALFALFLGDSRYEVLGRSYRPNVYRRNWYAAQFLNSEFWTNSRGFRDTETIIPKPDGVVRIVCIGGSTTVEGPHNALTYPKYAEKTLREQLKTDKIEFINCGVDALGFPIEMERMPDWLVLEPDMILHYNIVNNMPGILEGAVRNSGMSEGWKGRMRDRAKHSHFLASLIPGAFWPEERFVVAEIESLINYCYKGMIKKAAETGTVLAVASFAVPDASAISTDERRYFDRSFYVYPMIRATTRDYNLAMDIYNKTVKKFCQENNVLYIPVAENFSGGIDTFTDICHMRLRGIELKAQIMADHLEDFVREKLEVNARPVASGSHDSVPPS